MTSTNSSPHDSAGSARCEELWIGLDIGTQSVKGIVVDSLGRAMAEGTAPLKSTRRNGKHEQDPHSWIMACAEITRGLVSSIGAAAAASIRGVATCSTSGTVTAIGESGAPVGPGIMYDDARASGTFYDVMNNHSGLRQQFSPAIQPTWALAKILWYQQHGLPDGAVKIVHQTDVVAAAMTGHLVSTDWSSALKSGYDLERLTWPIQLWAELGADASLMSQVVAPGTVLGLSSRDWQDSSGLPAGIPIIAGTTDGCAAQIGAGALEAGDWHSVIGTTMVIKGVSQSPIVDSSGVVYSHLSPEGVTWFPGGASNIGAGAISELLPGRDLDTLAKRASRTWEDHRAEWPICYPLIGTGERFPVFRSDARGFLIEGDRQVAFDRGLSVVSDRGIRTQASLDASLLGAIMLGVSCVERLSFDVFARAGAALTGRLTTSGGGSRSPEWNRLRASMMKQPLHITRSSEGSLGMAILAAWAVNSGGCKLAEIARKMNPIIEVVEPDSNLVTKADEHFRRFTSQLEQEGWFAL